MASHVSTVNMDEWMRYKEYNPYSSFLNHMPIPAWYVGRFGYKNGHQKTMSSNEFAPCAQNMITVLSSTINIIERTYMTIE